MMTFVIRFVWFCNVKEHWYRTVFSKVLYGNHFRGQGLSLGENEWTINYWIFCFELFLSTRLSLNVKFVHIKS